MLDRAEAREPCTEFSCTDAGVPGAESLGVVMNVQHAANHLLTRPVFVPREALDDLSHFLSAGGLVALPSTPPPRWDLSRAALSRRARK